MEIGGELGFDPFPYSLRELFVMRRNSWDKTAAIVAAIANTNGGKKSAGRPYFNFEMNPFRGDQELPKPEPVEFDETVVDSFVATGWRRYRGKIGS